MCEQQIAVEPSKATENAHTFGSRRSVSILCNKMTQNAWTNIETPSYESSMRQARAEKLCKSPIVRETCRNKRSC